MIAQPPLDVGALHAFAPSVNQADFAEARIPRRAKVLVNHRPHVPRCKRVQVDRLFNRDFERFVFHSR